MAALSFGPLALVAIVFHAPIDPLRTAGLVALIGAGLIVAANPLRQPINMPEESSDLGSLRESQVLHEGLGNFSPAEASAYRRSDRFLFLRYMVLRLVFGMPFIGFILFVLPLPDKSAIMVASLIWYIVLVVFQVRQQPEKLQKFKLGSHFMARRRIRNQEYILSVRDERIAARRSIEDW